MPQSGQLVYNIHFLMFSDLLLEFLHKIRNSAKWSCIMKTMNVHIYLLCPRQVMDKNIFSLSRKQGVFIGP